MHLDVARCCVGVLRDELVINKILQATTISGVVLEIRKITLSFTAFTLPRSLPYLLLPLSMVCGSLVQSFKNCTHILQANLQSISLRYTA